MCASGSIAVVPDMVSKKKFLIHIVSFAVNFVILFVQNHLQFFWKWTAYTFVQVLLFGVLKIITARYPG